VHLNYTVEEVAKLLHVHRHTVRERIRRGLPTTDQRRPLLIRGRELVAFLRARRAASKRTGLPGEIYCVRCREPRRPAEGMADYRPLTASLGNLIGICPSCECVVYRRVNRFRLAEIRSDLDVRSPEGLADIGESPSPSVNSDFREERAVHAKPQPH
jgi:excisionase family DNA binding protein